MVGYLGRYLQTLPLLDYLMCKTHLELRPRSMVSLDPSKPITIGVLALQGAFAEHITLLHHASSSIPHPISIIEVRTPQQLESCDALIIPGGESTAISLVAERSGLLEPLRHFVKFQRRPTWGTCAGLILLAESANRTKKGGQELIGGIDVRVNRNHFGRQTESFQALLDLPFLGANEDKFRAVFIRAPIVEHLLPSIPGAKADEAELPGTVIAPSQPLASGRQPVEVMAKLEGRGAAVRMKEQEAGDEEALKRLDSEAGDIVAVRQGNVFGTSFHPELTGDERLHVWWLKQVMEAMEERRALVARVGDGV